jgi:hypothetical protein
LGLYSTAISISQDNQLRRSIKKVAAENQNLLGSIGTAQMDAEIWKRVNKLKPVVEEEEREMEQRTGVQSSIEDKDVKSYVEEVLREFGKTKIQK